MKCYETSVEFIDTSKEKLSENQPLQEPGIAAPQRQEGDVKPTLFDPQGRYTCTHIVTVCDGV